MSTEQTPKTPTPFPWTTVERPAAHNCFGPKAIEILIKAGTGNAFATVSLGGIGATDYSPEAVRANAAFIVEACNNYASLRERERKLVEALETIRYFDWSAKDVNTREDATDKMQRIAGYALLEIKGKIATPAPNAQGGEKPADTTGEGK